jgi:16S rRNA (uracil1498-N3)-methyltransferase
MPRTHASLQRLYIEHALDGGGTIDLGREQSNYLIAVLRKRAGDEVILFNGRDGAWLCRIGEPNKKAATLDVIEQCAPQTPPSDLWLGFAPLKTARLDYVIQKATEMGVGIIQPVITQYTQVSKVNTDRMRANAIEAAEQCEVLTVPEIAPEIALGQLIQDWSIPAEARVIFFADEAADSSSPIDTLAAHRGKTIGMLVGPEGGFSPAERDLLLAQPLVVPISLGPRILRADTAAVAALAVIQATIGDWR